MSVVYTRPGSVFYPEAEGAPAGLVGTIGVRVMRNSDGTTVVARTSAGITEQPAGSGHYVAKLTAPAEAGSYSVVWDTGSITPSTVASDELEIVDNDRVQVLSGPGIVDPDDVARQLGISPTPPAPWAEDAIEAAESWARRFLRRPDLGTKGDHTESFEDVRSEGYIPTQGPVKSVSAVLAAGGTAETIPPTGWTYDGRGVRLRPSATVWWIDEENAIPHQQAPKTYVRVDVVVEGTEAVDPMVVQGVAIAAASILTRSPRLAKGLQSERIGDYGYTLNRIEAGDPWFEQAKSLLRPYRVVGPLVP